MNEKPLFTLEDILQVLPHRPPFLFVDQVLQLEPGQSILAERALRPEEPQFAGHFPGRPIMPGVLVAEALAQTSGLLLGLSDVLTAAQPPAGHKMFFLATTSIKFTHPTVPGDVLLLRAVLDKNFYALFRFNVEATVGRNLIASGSLTLARIGAKTPATPGAVGGFPGSS
jgi:3-hydroxymyristoyl/3-hydroxydecanoyl-(acyl carrier protein) dehydratase